MMLFLTRESKVELLGPDVVIFNSAEQRLPLHYEQIRTVLPSFGHCTNVLQKLTRVMLFFMYSYSYIII